MSLDNLLHSLCIWRNHHHSSALSGLWQERNKTNTNIWLCDAICRNKLYVILRTKSSQITDSVRLLLTVGRCFFKLSLSRSIPFTSRHSIENLLSNLSNDVWSSACLLSKCLQTTQHNSAYENFTLEMAASKRSFQASILTISLYIYCKWHGCDANVVFYVVLMINTGNQKHASVLLNFQLISLYHSNKMILADSYLSETSSMHLFQEFTTMNSTF